MFSRLIMPIALSCFLASCERGSRNVNIEDPCASKDAKQTTACLKRSQNGDVSKRPDSQGDQVKVDTATVKISLQSACTSAKHKDEGNQCKCSNSATAIRYSPYLNSPNPTMDFKSELSSRCKKEDTTSLPPSEKPQDTSPGKLPSTPSTPSGDPTNVPVPSGNGTDQTANAGLAIFVSNTGVPTLVFTKDNAAKFSSMDYSTEPLTLAAQTSALAMQGQSNVMGALALKISLSFRFDSKTCTGSATAKFVEQTSIAVMCQ